MALQPVSLEAKSRDHAGKGPARRTRMEGLVPAVVYGRSLEKPMNVAINAKALKAAIATPKRQNTVLSLKIDAKETRTVLLKEYQLDPVSKELLHADFVAVKENEPVKVRVPVVLTGRAEGTLVGGILSQMKREMVIFALPAAIPEKLEVDVTPLKIGGSVHVNDLKLPAGITIKTQVNYTIAVVTAPEVEKVVEPTAAVAAAPGAAGAAPAAGAAAGDKKAEGAAAGGDKKAEAKPAAKK